MAMESGAGSRRRLPELLAGLFEEARRFQRRRRRVYLVLVLCALVAAGTVALFGRGGGANRSGSVGSLAPPRASVLSRSLPALGESPWLAVAGDRLIVSDTDNMSFAHGRVQGVCVAASVDPGTLRVAGVARGNCGDPALFGEHVMAVVYVPTLRDPPGWGTNPLAMRIAIVNPTARAGYVLGPVVVEYADCSDCRAQTIQGAGSLWVYASMAGTGTDFGELLRISETTGRVVERWRMPQIDRALLATNASGLWLAPSIESGWPAHATSAEKVADESLYHVASGMAAPVRVFDVGPGGASWLAAKGRDVWFATARPKGAPLLWRFDGFKATPAVRSSPLPGQASNCWQLSSPGTVLPTASGIYCVDVADNAQRVDWLEPSGRRSAVVASIPTPVRYDYADNAVTYSGSYYFIDPPAPLGYSVDGLVQPGTPATLYRITPHGHESNAEH